MTVRSVASQTTRREMATDLACTLIPNDDNAGQIQMGLRSICVSIYSRMLVYEPRIHLPDRAKLINERDMGLASLCIG